MYLFMQFILYMYIYLYNLLYTYYIYLYTYYVYLSTNFSWLFCVIHSLSIFIQIYILNHTLPSSVLQLETMKPIAILSPNLTATVMPYVASAELLPENGAMYLGINVKMPATRKRTSVPAAPESAEPAVPVSDEKLAETAVN